MPADEDYRSAAAALATSTTRTESPRPSTGSPLSSSLRGGPVVQRNSSPSSNTTTTSDGETTLPTWARPTPSSFRRLSTRPPSNTTARTRFGSFSSHRSNPRPQTLKSRALNAIHALIDINNKLNRVFASLSPLKQSLVLLTSFAFFTLAILFLIYSHSIFTALKPVAEKWRALPFGWLIVWFLCFCTAFPPAIGYSTTVSIAGFVYGFPWGWPIVASATVAGSTAAFFTSRGIFAKYVNRLVGSDTRFVALAQVLRRDGLGVLALIRFCPLPYSLSNGFLATVPSIRVGSFAAATALSTPKLAIHVFIGSRIAQIVENGDKMSGRDRAINYISMIIFGIVGTTVGIVIYKRTMARAAELAREEGLAVGDDPLGDAAAATAEGIIGVDGGYDDDDELDFNYADEEEGTRLMRAGNSLNKNGNADLDVAAVMNDDDDISLWETDGGYRDSWDEEAAVQGNGIKR